MSQTYYLDPDYRKDVPEGAENWCARCQKVIKDTAKAVKVVVNYDNWEVTEGWQDLPAWARVAGQPHQPLKNEYLGRDCWKIISNLTPAARTA